jgi:hypothetical protein
MLAVLALGGCRGAGDISSRMVPPDWKGNPWGPEAEEARRSGRLPAVPYSPPMIAWDAWARGNLRDGDILFRMGDARAALGLFPFSRISAEMADSRYSHSGVVALEGGEPVVYDTTKTGPRRQPFAVWVLDTVGDFAVRRPGPAIQKSVPRALAYCRDVYRRQVPFDRGFAMGDDRLYCIELTERAYRSAGVTLSEPIRIEQLPRYHEFPNIVRLVRLFTALDPGQWSYIIGNDRVGIWSNPELKLVYEAPDARQPYCTVPSNSEAIVQTPAGATSRR